MKDRMYRAGGFLAHCIVSRSAMAFCPSLLLLRAAVVTLPPTLARKPSISIRSSQSAAVGEFSLGSPRSLRSKNFSLDLRKFRNLREAGFEVGRRGSTSRPRCVSSSSSSSASTPMAADADARATKAEDSVMESASGNSVVGTAGNGSSSDRDGLSACEEETPKYAVVNNDTSSSGARGATLEELKWDHTFVDELPGDARTGGPVRQVLHACYTKVAPSAIVKDPQLVSWSEPVAQILGIDPKEFERPDFPHFFSGEKILQGSIPYAQCYGGHQFGMWAGQLGDGRAITLGEILNRNGSRWELQLKGSGKTPYSRMADGLAVLRSSVREFLCSEAVHHLGIPTTRALSLVMTGASVERDMFYDGHPKLEPGAVVCRVAPSFLRFGSYQIHAARSQDDIQIVQQLADYTIKHHFEQYSDLGFERQGLDSSSTEEASDSTPDVDITKNKYAAWFADVAERTAVMIAKWQGVGFTHGVMNTDNMSILGLTIDYGPFGFLDAFDPKFTPNTTDLPGRRYCFANQPDIGLWNTVQLANTLHAADLISTKEAQYCLGRYADKFMEEYRLLMSQKMGLKVYNKDLLTRLLNNLATDKVDYTNFFRVLANVSSSLEVSDDQIWLPLKPAVLDLSTDRKKVWVEWLRKYTAQLSEEGVSDPERKASMNKVNPKYILRNYLCQTAIDQAEIGDFSEVHRLLKLLEQPYDEQPGMEKYARLPPAWAYRPGVCMLSCSS